MDTSGIEFLKGNLYIFFIPFLVYMVSFLCFRRDVLLLFMAFVLFQLLMVEQIGGDESSLARLVKYADEGFILASFVLVVLDLFLRGRPFRWFGLGFPLLGVTLVGIIGSLLNKVPTVVWTSGLILLMKGFLVFYIFAHLPFGEKDLRRYLRFMVVMAGIILFLGFVDLVNPAGFRKAIRNVTDISWRFGIPSVQSIFTHPGIFGWFCGFIALFFLAFYFTTGRDKFLLISGIFCFGLMLSMRRKPLGGVFVAGLAGMLALPLLRRVQVIIVFAMALVIVSVFFGPRVVSLFERAAEIYVFEQDPTKVARPALYITSVKVAREYFPLGAGLGRYGGAIAARFYSPIYIEYGLNRVYGLEPEGRFLCDTFWPMILGELGVIGLAFYIWACWRLLRIAWRAQRTLSSPLLRGFALGTFMVFVQGIVESVAEPVFVKPPLAYFIFAALGISVSLLSVGNKKDSLYESSLSQ